MDDWDELHPACMLGVGLEWVCGIGEKQLAVRISIHYKIALLSFISICSLAHMRRPRIRLTQNECRRCCINTSRTDLSALLCKDLKDCVHQRR
jgi:hypothetical protein